MEKKTSKYYETAQLMDEALLVLLEKKDFAFITIKEICAKAGVNRSTFYLHYENTSDLLAETISMIGNRFYESFKSKSTDLVSDATERSFFITPDYLIPYLEFVKENKKIFSLIHKKPELFRSRKVFDKMYADLFSPILDRYGLSAQEKPYVFEFYSRGTLAVVMKWLENDCKDEIGFVMELIIRMVGYDEKS